MYFLSLLREEIVEDYNETTSEIQNDLEGYREERIQANIADADDIKVRFNVIKEIVNEKFETLIQQMISFCCISAALLLFVIALNGGSFWSSETLITPLIALNLIITIAARINLRGKQVSQGMNPHQINRKKD